MQNKRFFYWILMGLNCFLSAHSKDVSPENDYNVYTLSQMVDAIVQASPNLKPSDIYKKLFRSAAEVDDYSCYLDKEELERFRETSLEGHFVGIGIMNEMRGGKLYIYSVLPHSPAEKAGILPGDEIVAIDGQRLCRIHQKLDEKMHGAEGTWTKLHIRRGKESPLLVKAVQRKKIKIMPVQWKILQNKILYIKILTFNYDTLSLTEKAIAEAKIKMGKDPEGVLLDLRNNGGGEIQSMINLASLFLSKGIVFHQEGRIDFDAPNYLTALNDYENLLPDTKKSSALDILSQKTYRVEDHQVAIPLWVPMVVLINERSASGAEILAAALKENKRALIVGVQSFGKGSSQTIFPLIGRHEAMKLTVSKTFSPDKNPIQNGVLPDIYVPKGEILFQKDEDRFFPESHNPKGPKDEFASDSIYPPEDLDLFPEIVAEKDSYDLQKVVALNILKSLTFSASLTSCQKQDKAAGKTSSCKNIPPKSGFPPSSPSVQPSIPIKIDPLPVENDKNSPKNRLFSPKPEKISS